MRRLIIEGSPLMVKGQPQEMPVASGSPLSQEQNLKGKKGR